MARPLSLPACPEQSLANARVSFEFSRMATVLQQSIPKLVEKLGPERLVYGSGIPLRVAKPALLKLELVEAPPAVKERLSHQNMERLLSHSKPQQ